MSAAVSFAPTTDAPFWPLVDPDDWQYLNEPPASPGPTAPRARRKRTSALAVIKPISQPMPEAPESETRPTGPSSSWSKCITKAWLEEEKQQEIKHRSACNRTPVGPFHDEGPDVWIAEYTSAFTPGYLPVDTPVRAALGCVGEAMRTAFDDGAFGTKERADAAKREATAHARNGKRKLQTQAQARENTARRELTRLRNADDSPPRLQDERAGLACAVLDGLDAYRHSGAADEVLPAADDLLKLVKGAEESGRVRRAGGHPAPTIKRMPRPRSTAHDDAVREIAAVLGAGTSRDALHDVVAEYLTRRADGDTRPLPVLVKLCAVAVRKHAREDALRHADSHDFSAADRDDLPQLSLDK